FPLHGRTLAAPAAAAGGGDAGGGAAAVLLPGAGQPLRRLPRRIPRVLGPLPGRRRRLLQRRRRLPGAADLEPPVVRGLPVVLHPRAVAAAAIRAARPGAARGAPRPRPRRARTPAVAAAVPGAGADRPARRVRLHPRPGRRLVQPRPVLRTVHARLPG